MGNYIYKVHIRSIVHEFKFSCNSIRYINKRIKHFINSYSYRLNIIVRNYDTNDIIQDSRILPDLTAFNRFDNSFKLIKRKNSFYFANYENKRKI